MKPHQYHRLLVELDRTLDVFDEATADFSAEDLQLRLRIATLRSQVLKAGSGHPFALDASAGAASMDPDLTPAPWTKVFVSDRDQIPPGIAR